MNKQAVIFAAIQSWNHKRLPLNREPNMTKKAFVEDPIYSFAVVNSAMGFANHTSPRGWRIGLRHEERTPASAKDGLKKKCNTRACQSERRTAQHRVEFRLRQQLNGCASARHGIDCGGKRCRPTSQM